MKRDWLGRFKYPAAILVVFVITLVWIQHSTRTVIRKMEDALVLSREPATQSLPPIVLNESTTYTETQGLLLRKEEAFWVTVPIQNVSTISWAGAHRVQVVVTFSPDNPIKEIKADSFEVIDGGKGKHSVTLELSVLYPGSVIYLSFLVDKGEIPQVSIDWAEKRD